MSLPSIPKPIRNIVGAGLLVAAEKIIHPDQRVDLIEAFRRAALARIADRFGGSK